MRSLFIKIFLWFWLAMTLVGAIGIVIALTTDPKAAIFARYEKRLSKAGKMLVEAHERGGSQAVIEEGRRIEREDRLHTFLFKGNEGPLSGQFAPPRMRRFAAMASLTGEPQHGPGRRGIWYAFPLEGSYVVVAELPRPSSLSLLLDPRNIFLRLIVTFIVAGIVCYLLARSLTAPIQQLRQAARQFAGGALSTRVGPVLGSRKDEIADLGHDFDRMAGQIGALLNSQQQLLRDISHELRSPLARLNVALELARQRSGPEAGDALDRIEREAGRLNQLIGELVTLTLLESGSDRIEKKKVSLTRIMKDVAADADFEAHDLGRAVAVTESEEIMITGSEEMLRRAIENVVRNAVYYSDEGTTVEVGLHSRKHDGQTVAVITVRDYGPGVPEEALSKLFKPFYRVADSRDRLTGGTGIGLAITKKAVHLHGGSVKASNAPEGGLMIEITLPLGGEPE